MKPWEGFEATYKDDEEAIGFTLKKDVFYKFCLFGKNHLYQSL